ncbi:MAG: tetratricopeptide repeat protein [Rhodoglobus sp.]|nr:tetratricopeptide repeat protein [Rhodoglobus sp.]
MSNANPASLRGAVDLSSLVRPPTPAPGATEAAAGGGVARTATDATFGEILDLSSTVPVVVEFYGQGVEPTLAPLIRQYGGRIAIATVDGTTNPQLVQAFQVQQVPTVAAVVAGRPIQLFAGMVPEAELRDVLEQLLQLAAQQDVTGTLALGDDDVDPTGAAEPGDSVQPEEPLPPHHQEAYDAISAGDFPTAIREYETAIAQNPRDQLAVAGLAQVSLLARLDGADAEALRSAAAARPDDVDAQLAVADLDVSGGHLDDALGRLLDIFPTLDATGKNLVRTRLLDYFEIAGAEDPRVIAGRRRLTGLLY